MADDIKIDKDKLKEYDKNLNELWEKVQNLSGAYDKLTSQEKVLAGGIVVEIANPWNDHNVRAFVGSQEIVANLLNRAITALRQPQPQQKPTIFGKGNGETK